MDEFPKYGMKIGEGQNVVRKFCTRAEAIALLIGSGMNRVQFGRYVLNADFTFRKMSVKEKNELFAIANNRDANK